MFLFLGLALGWAGVRDGWPYDAQGRLTAGLGGVIHDIEKLGAVPDATDDATMMRNGGIMNTTFQRMKPGDTLLVPPKKTFHMYGGITATGLRNISIQIDGTLEFADNRKLWPVGPGGKDVLHCFNFDDIEDVLFTSFSRVGMLNGNGHNWWGAIKYLENAENRPRILNVKNSARLVVEYLVFKDSPYWTTNFDDIINVTIRHCTVDVKYNAGATTHTAEELTAFNTDGFDLAGENVHVHDCQIWNDDDCVAVKSQGGGGLRSRCSQNWMVERVNASGLGLTIGSVGASDPPACLSNITFRDSTMINTFKGIYIKSRSADPGHYASITDILYENITMERPEQWAVWIGPAQQADSSNVCSLLWPQDPLASCPVSPNYNLTNIVLRDITINSPKTSPGVLWGNLSNPMDITFDNVVVNSPGADPFGDAYYACTGVHGNATATTKPVPPCFNGGSECVKDTTCQTHLKTPCCSGRSHFTAGCAPYYKCGCVAAGTCADTSAGCCSGKCHHTIDCGVGITCRCD